MNIHTAQSIRDFFFDFLLKWPSFRFKLPFYFSTWALKGIWSQYNFISLTFWMKNREKNNEMPIWRTIKFYWKAIFIANINFLPTRFSSQSKTTTWNGIFYILGQTLHVANYWFFTKISFFSFTNFETHKKKNQCFSI